MLDVNGAFEALIGYGLDEVAGRSLSNVLGAGFSDDGCTQPAVSEMADGHGVMSVLLTHKDGMSLPCSYRKIRIWNAQGDVDGMLHIFHSEDRPVDSAVALPGKDLDPSNNAFRDVGDARLLARLDILLKFTQVDGAALWVFDPGAEIFHQTFTWGDWDTVGPGVENLKFDIARLVLDSQEPEFPASQFGGMNNPENQPGGLGVIGCLPYGMNDYEKGVIWFVKNEGISPADLDTLTNLADLVSGLFEKSQLAQLARIRGDRLAALRKIEIAIKESYDLKVAMGVLLDQIVQQLGMDGAAVLLLRPDALNLEFIAHRGFRTSSLSRQKFRLGNQPPGKVALDRLPIHIPAIRERPDSTEWDSIVTGEGFIGYMGTPLIARGATKGVLEVFSRRPLYPDPEWESFFEAAAGQAAIAIDKAELFGNWQRSAATLDLSYDSTLQGWLRALELRDGQTSVPNQAMIDKTLELAMIFGIPDQALVHLRRGVILHDIGKIGVPDHILFKPGPLDDQEWGVMRRHPIFAYEMLSPIPYLRDAVDIPYCHHERWDGRGYPRGLRGDDIPLGARIFSIVDVWASMTSPRPYRDAIPPREVRQYIKDNSARHFDRRVVDVFLGLM
jgi:HD-GYP domain-containing protein (c-di-GMP phosphodiesterase class II)